MQYLIISTTHHCFNGVRLVKLVVGGTVSAPILLGIT